MEGGCGVGLAVQVWRRAEQAVTLGWHTHCQTRVVEQRILSQPHRGMRLGWHHQAADCWTVSELTGPKQCSSLQCLAAHSQKGVDSSRCCCWQVVHNTDLVVGDVLMVNMGDKVVADGIMIDGFHLVVDEASLTGKNACVLMT